MYILVDTDNKYVRRLRIVLVPASETSSKYYVSQSAEKGRHRYLLGTVIGHICLMLRLDR